MLPCRGGGTEKIMKNKMFAAIAAALSVSILFSGCGTKKTAEDDGKITISIGGTAVERTEKNAASYDLFMANVEKFEKENPNVKVKADPWSFDLSNYLTKAAANDLPTMYFTSPTELKTIVQNGYAKDITSLMEKYGYTDKINDEKYKKLYMYDNKYYGVVKDGSLYDMGIMYNIPLFKQAGLTDSEGVPQFPQTWDELAQTAKTIKDKTGKPGFAIATKENQGGWHFLNIMWAFGADFMEEKDGKWIAKFASPEGVAALQYVKDLKWKYNVLQDELIADITVGGRLLATNEAAMAITQSSQIDQYVWQYDMKVGDIAMSAMPAGPKARTAQISANIYVFSGTDEENDACFKWLEMLGEGPQYNDDMKAQWEEKYKIKKDKGYLVGMPAADIWTNEDRINAENEVIQKYATVDPKFYENYSTGEGIDYRFEPERCVQQLYSALDNVLQNVLLDENADCKKVLEDAQKDFQANFLDHETN